MGKQKLTQVKMRGIHTWGYIFEKNLVYSRQKFEFSEKWLGFKLKELLPGPGLFIERVFGV